MRPWSAAICLARGPRVLTLTAGEGAAAGAAGGAAEGAAGAGLRTQQ